MGAGLPITTPTDNTGYITVVADAKTATTNPYRPATATGTLMIPVSGYNIVYFRAKYPSAMTVDPIIAVWGLKGGTWCSLYNSAATPALTQTLSDVTGTDCYDGVANYWTHAQYGYPTRGCEYVMCTVVTAGTVAAWIMIEASRA